MATFLINRFYNDIVDNSGLLALIFQPWDAM